MPCASHVLLSCVAGAAAVAWLDHPEESASRVRELVAWAQQGGEGELSIEVWNLIEVHVLVILHSNIPSARDA